MHAVVNLFCIFNFVVLQNIFSILLFCKIIFFYYYYYLDFPLERKTPVVYEDGVYEIVAESRRGNVLVISNLTQHGLSGLGSARRTAFFTFFGMQNYIANQMYYCNS